MTNDSYNKLLQTSLLYAEALGTAKVIIEHFLKRDKISQKFAKDSAKQFLRVYTKLVKS